MILAVFVISFTSGTEAEFQIRTVLLCPAADRAFMLGDGAVPAGTHVALRPHRFVKFSSALHFLWAVPGQILAGQVENTEIQERCQDRN